MLGPDGEETADRLIVPVNPPRLVSVIVEVVEDPGVVDMDAGFAVTLKSGDCTEVPKNSDIAVAPASFEVRDARFQFTSTVFVRE
jgi:hypothetical protein